MNDSLPAAATPAAPRTYAFEFRDTDSEYFRIWIINLGDVPRRVTFEDGVIFETLENDAVDAVARAIPPSVERGSGVRRYQVFNT